MSTATAANHKNPFPGLRPFREDEEYLFFGRENQVDAMVDKLAATRFLAVVGTSGSGKSSLVNCGLRPALHGGLMARAGTAWRMAQFRPGSNPMRALARALAEDGVLFRDYQAGGLTLAEIVDTTLRMSKLGLIDIFEQAQLGADVNLLVVVDQFEEMFRYRQFAVGHQDNIYGISEEAAAFVNLLLEAKAQTTYPIYVVLTMRSDFLGDCTQFPGLAEAINAGQYLVPRMTRDERRAAISGPVGVGGAEISPVLLTRLVNDVGDNPDQLSILQHALNRTWNQRERAGDNGPLDLPHYEAIGTMAHALDQHAETAYAELETARQQQICEKLFKALTDKATDPRGVRRPTTLGTLCALAGATPAEVTQVIDVFRQPSRSFLMPPAGDTLEAESVIDISHESLMRVWERLKTWADEEAQSAHIYSRLAETAVLHGEGKAGLWNDPDLQVALDWQEKNQPNKYWAQRYDPNFEEAMNFLEDSRSAREAVALQKQAQRRRKIKNAQIMAGVFAALFLLTLGAVVFAFIKAGQARSALGEKEASQKQFLQTLYVSNLEIAYQNFVTGNLAPVIRLLNQSLPDSSSPQQSDPRSFLWYYLWRKSHRELATLSGHTSAVNSVAFSPDGKIIASASNDETVKLWDARTRQQLATLAGHSAFVRSVTFSPDGKTVASASDDKTVMLWDVITRKAVAKLAGHTQGVLAVAFSPDGKTLVSASDDQTAKLWDLSTHQPQELPVNSGRIVSVAVSPDGKTIAGANLDGTVMLWAAATRQELSPPLRKPIPRTVLSVAFSPDGKTIASSDSDRTVTLWVTETHKELATLKGHSGDVSSVAFSPDGQTLASVSSDATLKLWDLRTRDALVTLSGHLEFVRSVAFSPDGKTLASASDDNTVKLWDAGARQQLQPFVEDSEGIFSVAFSPDGKMIATAREKGTSAGVATIKVWDAGTQLELLAFPAGPSEFARSVAFSPDRKLLAAGISDGTIKLLDLVARKELAILKGHSNTVNSVAFSPDGKMLASASSDNTVKLWDVGTGKELPVHMEHLGAVPAVAFSPDGKTLASASYDRTVKLWDVGTGKLLDSLSGHSQGVLAVAFSADGKTFASAGFDRHVKLWDVSTGKGKLLYTLSGHSQGVLAVVFSPDGKTLASAGFDHTVKLWDVDMRRELATLTEDLHSVYSVAFSPDGKTLASAGFDKMVKFWIAASDEEVESSSK